MTDETIESTIRVSSAVKLAGGLLVLAVIAAMLLPMSTALAIERLSGDKIELLLASLTIILVRDGCNDCESVKLTHRVTTTTAAHSY